MILFQIIDIFLRLDTFQRGQEALKNDFKHGIHDDAIETRSKLDKNSRKKKIATRNLHLKARRFIPSLGSIPHLERFLIRIPDRIP